MNTKKKKSAIERERERRGSFLMEEVYSMVYVMDERARESFFSYIIIRTWDFFPFQKWGRGFGNEEGNNFQKQLRTVYYAKPNLTKVRLFMKMRRVPRKPFPYFMYFSTFL